MTPRVVFRPQAETELLEARSWYEERLLGLGSTFAAAIENTIEDIIQAPLVYPRVHGDTRRAILRRFPYAIYFRVLDERVVVLAIMHGRRHPKRWQPRVY